MVNWATRNARSSEAVFGGLSSSICHVENSSSIGKLAGKVRTPYRDAICLGKNLGHFSGELQALASPSTICLWPLSTTRHHNVFPDAQLFAKIVDNSLVFGPSINN